MSVRIMSKMKRLTFAVFFWLALLTTCSAAYEQVAAQPQDPLRERLNFLKQRLEKYLTHSVSEGDGADLGSVTFEAVAFESCQITWRGFTEFSRGAETPAVFSGIKMMSEVSVDL